ncbi:hypothetical protein SK128_000997, partial [Halocaridina rubra]
MISSQAPPLALLLLFICSKEVWTEAGFTEETILFPGAPPIQYSTLTGPRFDINNSTTITVVEGATAILPCIIKNLRNYTVSWIRGRDIRLLTTNFFTYTVDKRFLALNPSRDHQWFLKIHYVRKTDAGSYLCQVSTTPPMSLSVNLQVLEAVTHVFPGKEVYLETGSRLELVCQVEGCSHPVLLSWTRSGIALNTLPSKAQLQVTGDSMMPVTTLTYVKLRAHARDSGKYTCSSTCTPPVHITVHVLR